MQSNRWSLYEQLPAWCLLLPAARHAAVAKAAALSCRLHSTNVVHGLPLLDTMSASLSVNVSLLRLIILQHTTGVKTA